MSRLILALLALAIGSVALRSAPLRIDQERSRLWAEVKATGHSFEAEVTEFSADIEVAADGSIDAARVTFAPGAIKTGNDRRDREMREWLESETYPEIEFKLREVRREGERSVGVGELTLHGVTKELELPFVLEMKGEQATLSGSATLNTTDFGLEVISMLFFKVKPELSIEFTLVGELAK